jgi:hypothetical protein
VDEIKEAVEATATTTTTAATTLFQKTNQINKISKCNNYNIIVEKNITERKIFESILRKPVEAASGVSELFQRRQIYNLNVIYS